MTERTADGKTGVIQVMLLQAAVFLYSLISVLTKKVAAETGGHGLFYPPFLGGLFLIFCSLAVYAFFWQKILKHVNLTVAYANKAIGMLWTLVWAVLLFGEPVTPRNVLGLAVICAGVLVVTLDGNGGGP